MCIHLKLNQEDAINIMRKGKASQALCSFVTMLLYNKINQVINCTSTDFSY